MFNIVRCILYMKFVNDVTHIYLYCEMQHINMLKHLILYNTQTSLNDIYYCHYN